MRRRYTSREQYIEEFNRICDLQELPKEMREEIEKAIFFQRPLKSQRGSVGPCVFEKGKPRAPLSHPLFERFRALQTVNNIKVAEPGSEESRPLTSDERNYALEGLLSKSETQDFGKLAKRLLPRGAKIAGREDREDSGETIQKWRFNYRSDTGLPGARTNSCLKALFGCEWPSELRRRYAKAEGKIESQVVDDIWHAMFSFDDRNKLAQFGKENLGLDEDQANRFAKQRLAQGYGSLSLSAIRKILPYLEMGLVYSHAVFMAKLPAIFEASGKDWQTNESKVRQDIEILLQNHTQNMWSEKAANALIQVFRDASFDPSTMKYTLATSGQLSDKIKLHLVEIAGSRNWKECDSEVQEALIARTEQYVLDNWRKTGSWVPVKRLDKRIKELLREKYGLVDKALLKLYHPSDTEAYPVPRPKEGMPIHLGTPRLPAIKNPVFMRTMFRLRKLVNALLAEGLIDADTRIRIEMARELNTANARWAIQREQKDNERERTRIRTEIESLPFAPAIVTDTDILKYRLWEEQGRQCLYTGKQIELSAFLGDNPAFDIEHTIPRSRRLDNAMSNMTLCEREFNRKVKRDRLPSELPNASDILDRVRSLWSERLEHLEATVEKRLKHAKSAQDKEQKDKARQLFHYERNRLSYWRAKMRSFECKDIPEDFGNSQLNDTRIICKYAMQYLKSVFDKVYSIKAGAVSAVKTIWGLDRKSRDDHSHHAIDAIVTACLSPSYYPRLARHFHEYERFLREETPRPVAPMPWPDFDRDLNENIGRDLLVVHYCPNRLLKQTRRVVRVRGRIVRDMDGRPRIAQGNTVRGSLHKETIYGKIAEPRAKGGNGSKIVSVVRKTLDKSFKNFEDIVDTEVRRRVMEQRDQLEKGETVWFDQEKEIPIGKVRVYVRNDAESLLKIGEHRDRSKHEYKRHRVAANGGNYVTGLYRGIVDGKPSADWKIVSNFAAAEAKRKGTWGEKLPGVDEKRRILKYKLRSGTAVLLRQSEDEDIRDLTPTALSRRLYRVTVMEGRILQLMHHRCAQQKKEVGKAVSSVDWNSVFAEPLLRLSANKIAVAVEGVEFSLDILGRVCWTEQQDA